MHRVELIDCQKFAREFCKQEKLLSIEPEEYKSIVQLLKDCVLTAENLRVKK